KLIRLVFFDRLGAPNLWTRFATAATARLRALVNFFENVGDHRRGDGAAVHFAADIAFVERGESVPRLVGRQKSGEPRGGALSVFWSPLRGPGLARDFNAVELSLVRRSSGPVHDVNHSGPQFVHRCG